jgi:choline dehydrogenase-like flavoprotein
MFDSNIPDGTLEEKWDNHKFEVKLVNPANRRRFDIIIVGSGLAGASAAATLGEAGYNVKVVTFHDSPRRAHSIAAQGGINAAKNHKNDGDSITIVLRHDQGRRLPLARGERLPTRSGVGRHHRPVRRAGRAVRA